MTDSHFFVGEENLAALKAPEFDDEANPGVTAFFPREFAEATAPPGLSFICAVNWSFAPGRERRDGLFIGRTRVGGFSWVLWCFSYDDNWERWDWKPLAATDRSFGSAELAASFMLEHWWAWERAEWATTIFGELEDSDVLSLDEVEKIAQRTLGAH